MKQRTHWFFLAAGLTMGLLVALGVWLGRAPAQSVQLPEHLLHAAGASSNDAFACCTGVLEDGEGLFVLDFLTGELTCMALQPRTGTFMGRFATNVTQALGADPQKKPRYLLATGMMDFPRGGGAARPARSVVYVVDGNTGNFAAYSVPWNPNAWSARQPISAPLVLIDKGTARTVQIGD